MLRNKKRIKAKIDFCRLFVATVPTLSKTYQGPLGFYQTLKNFKSKSIQNLLGLLDFLSHLVQKFSKPYLGQLGFYTFLDQFFSEAYFGQSVPSWLLYLSVQKCFRGLSELFWACDLFNTACWKIMQALSGPTWLLYLSWPIFSEAYFFGARAGARAGGGGHFQVRVLSKPTGPIRLLHKASWASYRTLIRPRWILSPLCQNLSSPTKNLSGPIGILSNPENFQVRILSKPTGPIRLFHKASWASYRTLIKPRWIFVTSLSKFFQPYQKPLRADWDFIKLWKISNQNLFKAYWAHQTFSQGLLGILSNPYQAKIDFCRLFVATVPALSKTYQGRLGFYQTLKNFKTESFQSLLGPSDFFTRPLGHPMKPLSGQAGFLLTLCRNFPSPVRNLWGPIGILSNPKNFKSESFQSLLGPSDFFTRPFRHPIEKLSGQDKFLSTLCRKIAGGCNSQEGFVTLSCKVPPLFFLKGLGNFLFFEATIQGGFVTLSCEVPPLFFLKCLWNFLFFSIYFINTDKRFH